MHMLYSIGPDLYVSIFGPRAIFKPSDVAVDNRLFSSHPWRNVLRRSHPYVCRQCWPMSGVSRHAYFRSS